MRTGGWATRIVIYYYYCVAPKFILRVEYIHVSTPYSVLFQLSKTEFIHSLPADRAGSSICDLDVETRLESSI